LRATIILFAVLLFCSSAVPSSSVLPLKLILAKEGGRIHTLSPVWASQSPDLKLKVLKVLGETVKRYPKKIENAVTIFDSYLDFTKSDADQVRLNIDVLNMLAEMPPEFKTLKIALNAVDFKKYKGEEAKALNQAGLKFFRSIPRELMFKKSNKNNNGQDVFLEGSDKRYYQEIRRYPLLTHIGEIKLGVLKLMGESEEERRTARDCLITSNLRLPFGVVRRHFWWTSIDMNRLVSAGNLGLIRAVKKYDPCFGKKFSTYAEWWLMRFITSFIRRQEDLPVSEDVHVKINIFLKKCQEANLDPKDKSTSDKSISSAIRMPSEEVQALRKIIYYAYVFLDSPIDKSNEWGSKNMAEFLGNKDEDSEKMENRIMTEDTIGPLKKLFCRVEKRIKGKEIEPKRGRLIAILRKRFAPKLLQTGSDKTLEQIGEEYNISRERVRQLEKELRAHIDAEAGSSAEKKLLNRLSEIGYKKPTGSFAEVVRIIYKKFDYRKFLLKEVYLDKEKYSSGIRYIIFTRLTQLSVLRRMGRGWYQINPIFKGRTDTETEENLAGLFNLTFESGVSIRKKSPVMEQYTHSKNKTFAIKECIQMELAHTFLERMISEANMDREPCVIRVWKGYASFAQEDLPQCIRDAMERRGPYVLEFLELDELINDTKEKKASQNEIMILPFNRLNVSQKRTLETRKAWFINMDFEKQILDPYAVVQLEAIIAAAIAYLNNDDFTFNNLYKMLTDSTDDIKVSIEELKENPISAIEFMFLLSPGKVHIDDLAPLNRRMKKLIDSAS